ncbi:MAG: type VI secretion system tip protein VgrG [Bacteroidota bacterium]
MNGAPLPQQYPLYAIEVSHEVNKISTACLIFGDGDAATGEWTLSSEEYFAPGNDIIVYAGYHSDNEVIFTGIVVSQSIRVRNNRLELRIICKNKTIALTSTKKSRHFTDATDSDAVNEILGDYDVQVGDIATTSVTHNDLVQFDSCDWDFIVMRMEANGLVCITNNNGFNVIEPTMDSEEIATVQFGANVIEFDGDIDARRQLGSVTSLGWDPAAQDHATGESSEPTWTSNGNFSSEELASAVGAELEILKHSGAVTEEELTNWSDAKLLRSRMAFVRGRVRITGFSLAMPGTVLNLEGFGERFNGPVWIGSVRHEISQGNWMTDIEFGMSEEWHAKRYKVSELPANGLLAAVSGLHTGVVTALEGDPLSEVRIRVKIPSIKLDGEGVWARISTLDAGSSRGSYFLPEIDDEVLVGFLNDDPRYPVVLGMLHSSAHAPPEEASDDNHIRGFYSREGMRIRFDDESTILTIDTPGGHEFILDDDAGEVKITDSNDNSITMSSSGITLESASDLILNASGNVTIESQGDIDQKAGANWKAEGSAGAEINTSAIAKVSGSLVQIN